LKYTHIINAFTSFSFSWVQEDHDETELFMGLKYINIEDEKLCAISNVQEIKILAHIVKVKIKIINEF